MKTKLLLIVLLSAMLCGGSRFDGRVFAASPSPGLSAWSSQIARVADINVFHESLTRYGQWHSVEKYGEVWRPSHASVSWRPYSVGLWMFTIAYGWTWDSDEEWGWATYHYGRWYFDSFYGWVWIPGTDLRPAWVAVAGPRQTETDVLRVPELDAGFRLLYELKFAEARAQFAARQQTHPEDPLGSAAEAASYLFEECYRQGILTSEFFLDDDRFLGNIPVKADAALRTAFFAASKRAQDLAQLQLKTNPDDANALFAMTLSLGMQADYASLIDKQQRDSLRMIGEANKFAKKLLAVAPEGADAYLTLGTANYIIGSLPAGKRFFLRFAGIRGDKRLGITQLETAAASGRYLRPFAKILLALTALREKKPDVARTQLTELVAEFPENPLFATELAKLNAISPAPQSH
jgi:Family of unknown function (DUF6600)